MEGGKCFYLAGKFPEARALLDAVTKTKGADAAEIAEASHWIARAYLKEGQAAPALEAAQAGQKHVGNGPFASSLLMDQADALYELPDKRQASVAVYAKVAKDYPQSDVAPQAEYMAGFASLNVADYEAALKYSEEFLKSRSDSSLAPDVMYVAAESHLLLKQYDQAAADYRRLLKEFPKHAEVKDWQVRLGLSLHLQQKYAETIAALTPYLAGFQQPKRRAEAYYLVGHSQTQLKQYAEAIKSLEASLAADPDFRQADDALLTLGSALRLSGDVKAAQKRLQELINRFPDSPSLDRAHYRLAEYAYDAGVFPQAVAEYGVVLKEFPKSELAPNALYGLGWAYLSQTQAAKAEPQFTRLLTEHPKNSLAAKAQYARGLARQQTKKYAPAAEDLRAFIAADPQAKEIADAYYVLGLSLVGQDKQAEAAEAFRSALKAAPNYADADKVRYELAWALKAQGDDPAAAEVFGELARQTPDSALVPESLYHVAEALYAKKDYEQAAVKYLDVEKKVKELAKQGKVTADQARELGEKAIHKLGWTAYRRDQFEKAEQDFRYQLLTYPKGALTGDARFMQAESLFQLKKYQEALDAYKQVGKPSSDQFAALAALHAAQAANQLKRYAEAEKLVEGFAGKFPKSELIPQALYEQSWALQNLDKPQEALKLYEEVTAKTNAEVAARARFMIGEIKFGAKDHKAAVADFFKVAYGYGYPKWQSNALFEAARCLEVLRKKDQAAKLYQEIVEKYADSDQAAEARQRLKALAP